MNKNKLFHWSRDYKANKDMVDYKWKERRTERLTFMEGRRLPFDSGNPYLSYTLEDPKNYDLVYHSEQPEAVFLKRYDILPNNGTAPLVNAKVKALLETLCPEDVQFFPATILPERSKMVPFENHDYWALNICSIYDDVNIEDSEFKYGKEGQIQSYKKCVFNELQGQKIPHIGRLMHSLGRIIVSPALVSLFKKEKIKGVRFYSEEEYSCI